MNEITKKPDKSMKGSRTMYAAALAGTLLAAAALVWFLFAKVKIDQKNTIVENAMAYSSLMDEKISVDLHGFLELNLYPALESSMTPPARPEAFPAFVKAPRNAWR